MVIILNNVSLGNLGATADSTLAGNLAIWFVPSSKFVVLEPPLDPAVKAIAEVDKWIIATCASIIQK